jgi:hypothetical protein
MSRTSTTAYPASRTRARQLRRRKRRFLATLLVLFLLAGGVICLAAEDTSSYPKEDTQDQTALSEKISESLASMYQNLQQEDRLTDGEKLTYIEEHPEEYTEDLIALTQKNREALDYVYQYPEWKDKTWDIDLSAEAKSDQVPLLLQWDSRWGYQEYGTGLIGYTGCGPTCLSMVALYITGNPAYTPVYVAEYALEGGYYEAGSGTAWSLMSQGSSAFGLSAKELPLDEGPMVAALKADKPIICALGPGDFTDNGHFIVLTGYTGEAFTVNDPNSPQRSGQLWTFDRLKDQIRNLWAFSAA